MSFCEMLSCVLSHLKVSDDPNKKFLACAIYSKTKIIMSGDKHLLKPYHLRKPRPCFQQSKCWWMPTDDSQKSLSLMRKLFLNFLVIASEMWLFQPLFQDEPRVYQY